MFETINNNVAYINGTKGKYDGKIDNPAVRYARNAMDNYVEYANVVAEQLRDFPDMRNLDQLSEDEYEFRMQEFEEAIAAMPDKKMPPLNFRVQYTASPVHYRFISRDAVLAVAYEEMGKKTSVSARELTKKMQKSADTILGEKQVKMSAKALDINSDGKISLGEYASCVLLEDALSENDSYFDIRNINGTISTDGENALLNYGMVNNYNVARMCYKNIYNKYHLADAEKAFLSDEGNLIE